MMDLKTLGNVSIPQIEINGTLKFRVGELNKNSTESKYSIGTNNNKLSLS